MRVRCVITSESKGLLLGPERPRVRLGMTVFLVLLALTLLPAVVFAEPNDGLVSGTLLNKTSGGPIPAGATVILVAFGRKEQAPLGQQTTTADASGHYSFTGLDRDSNVVYIPVARYGNVNYPGDTPFQLQDQPTEQIDINVYDSTTTDDAIQIERLNLLVMGASQGTLQCMQMGAITNNGDRTFQTANPQDQALARAVKFALPRGAVGVQMQTGFNQQDVIPSVGGIQVTAPLLPGRHEFAFSFQLPYSGSSADLTLQLPYPTTTYSVYLPNTVGRLDGGLTSGGTATLGGQSYALYSASNLAKATTVASSLRDLGSAPGGLDSQQLALLSLGVVLFVLGGGVVLFGSRPRSTAALAQVTAAADLEHERLELVVRLAALDERFAAGQLKQADYEQERSRGKQRLRELLLLQRQESLTS
jgi:hypothetical protein